MTARLSDEEKWRRRIDRQNETAARRNADEFIARRKDQQAAWQGKNEQKRSEQQKARRRAQGVKPKLVLTPQEARDRRREQARRYREENLELLRERGRAYYHRKRAEKIEAERAKVRAYKKAWRKANLERELARGRADAAKFRKTNPESVRESQRKWRADNANYRRQADRDRYSADAETIKARRRAYYLEQKAARIALAKAP